jgi:predicted Fe-S protein YdhL (DUF1289 family)
MRQDLNELFAALARSSFRSRFKLGKPDLKYLHEKGLELVLRHAADFIDNRLAPAVPPNDGKQTPWRGHPVFVAQHATGTCCRGCLAKWHRIPKGVELDDAQRAHVLRVIERWLVAQGASIHQTPSLFNNPG